MPRQSRGVYGAWWLPSSSKRMRPDDVGLGGFDSHTLPPAETPTAVIVARVGHPTAPVSHGRSGTACALVFAFLTAFAAASSPLCLSAQQKDTLKTAPAIAPDTRPAAAPTPSRPPSGAPEGPSRAGTAASPSRFVVGAPITPKRAFLYSLMLPGLGEASLQRYKTGAGFFLVEALALSMYHRSTEDLRIANAYRSDSAASTYVTDPSTGVPTLSGGLPVVATRVKSGFTDDLIKARKLQKEDWFFVLVFNHLISGADAFVAAQLFDLPAHVSLRAVPQRGGGGIGVNVGFR